MRGLRTVSLSRNGLDYVVKEFDKWVEVYEVVEGQKVLVKTLDTWDKALDYCEFRELAPLGGQRLI